MWPHTGAEKACTGSGLAARYSAAVSCGRGKSRERHDEARAVAEASTTLASVGRKGWRPRGRVQTSQAGQSGVRVLWRVTAKSAVAGGHGSERCGHGREGARSAHPRRAAKTAVEARSGEVGHAKHLEVPEVDVEGCSWEDRPARGRAWPACAARVQPGRGQQRAEAQRCSADAAPSSASLPLSPTPAPQAGAG